MTQTCPLKLEPPSCVWCHDVLSKQLPQLFMLCCQAFPLDDPCVFCLGSFSAMFMMWSLTDLELAAQAPQKSLQCCEHSCWIPLPGCCFLGMQQNVLWHVALRFRIRQEPLGASSMTSACVSMSGVHRKDHGRVILSGFSDVILDELYDCWLYSSTLPPFMPHR